MSDQSTQSHRPSVFRRLWKPAAVTGAGGTAVAVWLDEIVLFGEEILALIFLPILAGLIYLINIFIFKSHMPQQEDMKNSNDRGAKK